MSRTLFALAVALMLALLSVPLDAGAQAGAQRPARIGFIGNADPKTQASSIAAFRQGLREMALVEGRP